MPEENNQAKPVKEARQEKTMAVKALELFEKKEAERIDMEEVKNFLKFYALPLFSFIIFASILVFPVYNNIKYTFATVEEIDSLKEQDTLLQGKIEKLIALQTQNKQRQEVIAKINELIPTGKSEVVKFRERVASTSLQQSLELASSRSGEVIIGSSGNVTVATVEGLNLIQIPSEFSIHGDFINFRNFLNRLYNGEDFFIVEEMELTGAEDEEQIINWTGEFNLTKYQFYAGENFSAREIYGSVSEDQQPNQGVIDFIEEKFIGQTNQTSTTSL